MCQYSFAPRNNRANKTFVQTIFCSSYTAHARADLTTTTASSIEIKKNRKTKRENKKYNIKRKISEESSVL